MKKGFTILEILLVISVFGILTAISIPGLSSLFIRNNLDIAHTTVVNTIHRAQALSQAVDGDSGWGVKIQTTDITLYKGSSYAARDIDFDEKFPLDSTLSVSGLTEINFNKFIGDTANVGVATLTSSTGETRTVTINSKGGVDW